MLLKTSVPKAFFFVDNEFISADQKTDKGEIYNEETCYKKKDLWEIDRGMQRDAFCGRVIYRRPDRAFVEDGSLSGGNDTGC